MDSELLRLDDNGEWMILTPADADRLKEEFAQFEVTLAQDPVERNMALAQFYGERGLELKRIEALGNALFATTEQPNVQIAEELSDALDRTGFTEAALQTWTAIPTMIGIDDPGAPYLLSNAMQNRGRILESLDRPVEANIAFATARLMEDIAKKVGP